MPPPGDPFAAIAEPDHGAGADPFAAIAEDVRPTSTAHAPWQPSYVGEQPPIETVATPDASMWERAVALAHVPVAALNLGGAELERAKAEILDTVGAPDWLSGKSTADRHIAGARGYVQESTKAEPIATHAAETGASMVPWLIPVVGPAIGADTMGANAHADAREAGGGTGQQMRATLAETLAGAALPLVGRVAAPAAKAIAAPVARTAGDIPAAAVRGAIEGAPQGAVLSAGDVAATSETDPVAARGQFAQTPESIVEMALLGAFGHAAPAVVEALAGRQRNAATDRGAEGAVAPVAPVDGAAAGRERLAAQGGEIDPSAVTQEIDPAAIAALFEDRSFQPVQPTSVELTRAHADQAAGLEEQRRADEERALQGAVVSEEAQAEAARQIAEQGDQAGAPPAEQATAPEPAVSSESVPPEVVQAEPSGYSPGTEKQSHADAQAAAAAIEQAHQAELAPVLEQRRRGEIGKAQAAALKREIAARRDARMAAAMDAVSRGEQPPPIQGGEHAQEEAQQAASAALLSDRAPADRASPAGGGAITPEHIQQLTDTLDRLTEAVKAPRAPETPRAATMDQPRLPGEYIARASAGAQRPGEALDPAAQRLPAADPAVDAPQGEDAAKRDLQAEAPAAASGLDSLESRIQPSGDALHFEPLTKEWRKATGDRTPVEGSEGWQRLQREAAATERARQAPSEPLPSKAPPTSKEAGQEAWHTVGRAPSPVDLAPLPGGATKKTTDILLDATKSLGKRVWTGGEAKGSGGTYFPGTAKTVVKFANDLPVAAHELSHALDDRYGIVGRWAGQQHSPFDAELKPFWESGGSSAVTDGDIAKNAKLAKDPRSSGGYRRAEGVAEWMRAWLGNPDAAEQAAPGFAKFFHQQVPGKAIAALRSFGDDIRRHVGAPKLEQGMAHISDAGDAGDGIAKRIKDGLSNQGFAFRTTELDRLKATLQDALAPVMKGAEAALEMTGKQVLPESDPRVLMRLMGGVHDKVQDVLEHGMIDAKQETEGEVTRGEGIGGGLRWLTEPAKDKADLDRLGAFMVAERVLEKAGQIDKDLGGALAAARTRSELVRGSELDQVEKVAKKLRKRAEVQSRRAEQATGKEHAALAEAEKAGAANDADLGKTVDQVMERQHQRLSRMLDKLRVRATGAEASKIERRMAALRDRFDKRRRRVETKLQESIGAHDQVRRGHLETTEKQISAMKDAAEHRHQVRLARIEKKSVRLLAGAEAKKGRLSGMGAGILEDHKHAAATIEEVRANPELHARLTEMAKRYRTWANAVLKYQVDKGRLSQESYDQIRAKNEQYVAMHREDEASATGRGRGGKGLASVKQTVHGFEGSTKAIKNPIENLLEQTARSITESDRNEALRSYVDLLKDDRGMYQGAPRDLAQIGHQVGEGTDGAVKVFRDGKAEHWRFEEGVAESLKGWSDVAANNVLARTFQTLASIVRGGVTLHPGFLIRNTIRDAVERSVLSESGSKPWESLTRSDKATRSVQSIAGGSLAGHYLRDRASYQKALRLHMRELAGDQNTIVGFGDRLFQGYKHLAESSEQRGREAEFRRAYAKARADGLSVYNAKLRAAAEARGLLDFAVAGTLTRSINRYVPFVNARVQGLARIVRGIRANPAGVGARWAAYAVMPSVMCYAYNAISGNRDEYLALPAQRRDQFWNFKISANRWLSIPKPFELGTMASGVERAINAALGHGAKEEGKEYAVDVLQSASPLGVGDLAGPLRPLLESISNYDFNTGRNIVPDYEKNKPVDQRAGTKYASRIGQWLQAPTGIDARIIDHVVRGMLGSTGTTIEKASDIGRTDKTGQGAATIEHAIGMTTRSPGPEAATVERFRQEEAAAGRSEAKPSRRLSELEKTYFQAPGAEAKDAAAAELRDYATGKDPLRDFDRAAAESSRVHTELARLKQIAVTSRKPEDIKAYGDFRQANLPALERAKIMAEVTMRVQALDRQRIAAGDGTPKAIEAERQMRDLAKRALAAKP